MNIIKYIAYFLFLYISATGCSSIIRFSDSAPAGKNKSTKVSEESNIKGKLTKDAEYLRYYENIDPDRIEVVRIAESFLGVPYSYGGTTSSGFDCSGFVQTVFAKCGINLPRTSQQQYTYTIKIDCDDLEPGDLLFFGKNGKISHVGIYGGKGYMIHSSTSSGVVRQVLSDYLAYQQLEGCGRPAFH